MTRPKDEERPRQPAFDTDTGYSGQDYHRDEEARLGSTLPAGSVTPEPPASVADDPALPEDNGRRASVDPATGEVRGSGIGAGGGQEGEDPDSDGAAGDGAQPGGAG